MDPHVAGIRTEVDALHEQPGEFAFLRIGALGQDVGEALLALSDLSQVRSWGLGPKSCCLPAGPNALALGFQSPQFCVRPVEIVQAPLDGLSDIGYLLLNLDEAPGQLHRLGGALLLQGLQLLVH